MKKLGFIFCTLLLVFLVGCSKKATVTFVTNGADDIAPVELEKGMNLELTNVTKTGYKFEGWYLDSEFKNEFKDTVVNNDITLYAKWSVLKFTVKFEDHDGTQIGTNQSIEYGKGATAPANPTRVGYEFEGWDKAFNDIKADTVVKAKYNVNKFTVKFVDHDGTQIGTDQSIEYGKGATAPVASTRVGFKFTGWDKTFNNVTADITVTAKYEVQTYTVEFQDYNGTRIGEVQTIEYNKDAMAPANPTRSGYEFKKWDVEFTSVKSNLVIKATYDLVFYTIKYYDGETLLTHTPSAYNISSTVLLSTFEKDNLIFDGWYTDSEFAEATLMTEVKPGKTGELVLYGKWSTPTTIDYELNEGSWTWTLEEIALPGKGIDAYSNLPEIFMQDFYTYLKDNNLLTSSLVATKLHKTTWAEFSTPSGDPYAIYNHTSTNTSQSTDGYSQFFYTTATGNTSTLEVLTITGGFFGTEPYKTKYINLVQHLSMMVNSKYTSNFFWDGASSKALTGFVLDGYFYGTQGAGTGNFAALRSVAPNTNVLYNFVGTTLTKIDTKYQVTSYSKSMGANLVAPVKVGYVFGGWYDNVELNGEAVSSIAPNADPAAKYYAKWIAIA